MAKSLLKFKYLNALLLFSASFSLYANNSANNSSTDFEAKPVLKFLVFGGDTGWIGQKMVKKLKKRNYEVHATQARLENRDAILKEISKVNPDFVINCAGLTGKPNVDWCESNKQETIRANIIGALNLADICFLNNIHMTNFGTGCIYEYDSEHLMGSSKGFTEDDNPNFDGSYYSKTKIMLDKLLRDYPNVLNLRLRMPISNDLHQRNFVTKIIGYKKVINVPNSMTILHDLLPLSIDMSVKKLTGAYNFVNPGTISHNEILDLYKQYVNPDFVYNNFSLQEQNQILKARRSNNQLDTSKLLKEFPNVPNIKDSIKNVFIKMKAKLNKANKQIEANKSE